MNRLDARHCFFLHNTKVTETSKQGLEPQIVQTAKANEHLNMPGTCSICFTLLTSEDDDEQDEILQTQCGHYFHHSCIGEWYLNCKSNQIEGSCPLCRAKIEHFVAIED